MSEAPTCLCGCGQTTNARKGKSQYGYYRYLRNHHQRGQYKAQQPRLAPTMQPTALDIAWAAGFWEGEGSIVRHRGTYQVNAVQKGPECLVRLRDCFGGSISNPQSSQHRCHTWLVFGQHARNFVAQIYPYLSTRRKEQVKNAGYKKEENLP